MSGSEKDNISNNEISRLFWFVECGMLLGSVTIFLSEVHKNHENYHHKILPGAAIGGLIGLSAHLVELAGEVLVKKASAELGNDDPQL